MSLAPYEKLQIYRECLVKRQRSKLLSPDDFLEFVELYETDAEFKAFCDADEVLREPMGNFVAYSGPYKAMRDYFYKFRDFCYGRSEQPPGTQRRILSYYQSEGSQFRERCDADPVVWGVIEGWLRDQFDRLREFCYGIRPESPESPQWFLHLYQFTGPVFRGLCEADSVVRQVIERWLLDVFEEFQNFCYENNKQLPQSSIGESSITILSYYRSKIAVFKERCDADPVVREVIEQWIREEEEISRLLV